MRSLTDEYYARRQSRIRDPIGGPMSDAERSRRHRARKRGEDVPLLPPGQKPLGYYAAAKLGFWATAAGQSRSEAHTDDPMITWAGTQRRFEALSSAVKEALRAEVAAHRAWRSNRSTSAQSRLEAAMRDLQRLEAELARLIKGASR